MLDIAEKVKKRESPKQHASGILAFFNVPNEFSCRDNMFNK